MRGSRKVEIIIEASLARRIRRISALLSKEVILTDARLIQVMLMMGCQTFENINTREPELLSRIAGSFARMKKIPVRRRR